MKTAFSLVSLGSTILHDQNPSPDLTAFQHPPAAIRQRFDCHLIAIQFLSDGELTAIYLLADIYLCAYAHLATDCHPMTILHPTDSDSTAIWQPSDIHPTTNQLKSICYPISVNTSYICTCCNRLVTRRLSCIHPIAIRLLFDSDSTAIWQRSDCHLTVI